MTPENSIKTGITGLLISSTLFTVGIFVENGTVITMQPSKAESTVIKFSDAPDVEIDVDRGGLSSGVIKLRTKTDEYTIRPESLQFEGGKEKKDRPVLLTGNTSQDKSETKFTNVFGVGSEMDIELKRNQLRKVVKLDETVLDKLPKEAKYIEISFNISGSWDVSDGVYTERFKLKNDENLWLEKSLAWDSNMEGDPNQNYTDIEIEIVGDILIKRIPINWLKTAQFPVYTDAVFTFGTKELADTGPSITVDTLKLADGKFVNCWVDNADASQEGRCQVAITTGTDISFGSTSDYSADVFGTGNNQAASACAAGNDRWVVVFSDDADADDGTARVASSTGLSVNGYGTAFDFFDGAVATFPSCAYISTDKIIIGYLDVAGRDIEVIACTISATYTLSCGTPTLLFDSPFIGTQDITCQTLDTDKFVCVYLEGNSNLRLNAGTVSGTTITLGATTTLNAIGTGRGQSTGHNLLAMGIDQFIVTWANSTTVSNPPIALAVGTVSGTAITMGATTTPLHNATSSLTALVGVDSDTAFWMGQYGTVDDVSTTLSLVPIEVNFTTRTFSTSSPETIDTTTDPGSLHAAKISDCKFAFVWEDDNDTNDLFAEIGDLVNCVISSTDSGIIWFD